MPERPEMSEEIARSVESPRDEFLGELRLGRRLSGLPQILAVALLAQAGLIFLFQDYLVSKLGSLVIWAALAAGFLLLLTALSLIELLAGSGEAGGSFRIVSETLGGFGGFFHGWALVAGHVLVVAALARIAGAAMASSLGRPSATPWAAAAVVFALGVLQAFQWPPRRPSQRTSALAVIALLLLLLVSLIPAIRAQNLAPGPGEQEGFALGVAQVSLVYLGLEAVLGMRRQVRSPKQLLPRGLIFGLALGSVLTILWLLILAGLPMPDEDGLTTTWLAGQSVVPPLVVAGVVAISLTSAGRLVLASSRLLNSMSRRGALPDWLRGSQRPFALPPYLFAAVTLAGLPAAALAPPSWLVSLGAWMVILSLALVNLAAIWSRRTEADRRRWFEVPLYPLAPVSALAIMLALLLSFAMAIWVSALLWMVLGLIVYLAHSRAHQAEARAEMATFGREAEADGDEIGYRILVPLGAGEEKRFTIDLAVALAKQLDGEVLALQVVTIPDPLAIEEARRLARERNTLFSWSLRMAGQAGVGLTPITRLARSVSEGILDTASEEQCRLILMPWAVREDEAEEAMGRVLDRVVAQAPCDVAVVAHRPGEGERRARETLDSGDGRRGIDRILVPTAGGPNAPLAIGMALEAAEEFNASVRAVFVVDPEADEATMAEGEATIERTIETLRIEAAEVLGRDLETFKVRPADVEKLVIRSDEIASGIVEASREAGLVFIGASEEALIDQILFGNLPRAVAREAACTVVMVRRYQGLPRFWLRRLWEGVYSSLPTLTGDEQINVYKRVRRGARPDVDFFVMIGLSALIAALGLLLNSGPVIIGAMLVAPLFTPILAFSFAIALGDIRLLRLAFESTLKGVFLAIGLATAMAALTPLPSPPLDIPEVASRVQPNLLDLGVALASGAAGAYALARKDVAAALPGVAIAAALVPPLGVVGIGLATGELAAAAGAGLLVITNLIAISLAGSIVLLLLGFRPSPGKERQARLRTGLTASILLLIAVSVPLATVLVRTVERSRTQRLIQQTLTGAFEAYPGTELAEVEVQEVERELRVTATLHVTDEELRVNVPRLVADLRQVSGRPIRLRLLAITSVDVEASSSSP